MGKKFLALILSTFLLALTAQRALAAEKPIFEIAKDGAITAQATNARLQDVLNSFSVMFNVEVRGIPATTEPITINLSRATFDETLKRLLRGYNYVQIHGEASGKPAVVILGKAERAKYVDEPSPARQAAVPSTPAPAPSPGSYGTLPSRPGTVPAQASTSPRKSGLVEQQKRQDEPASEAVVASSARPGRALRSDMPLTPAQSAGHELPPAPPQIPGLELPPMPPSIEEVRGSGQTVALDSPPQIPAENSSGQAALQTPPEIPTSTTTIQEKPKPKLDLNGLAPPSIPF